MSIPVVSYQFFHSFFVLLDMEEFRSRGIPKL